MNSSRRGFPRAVRSVDAAQVSAFMRGAAYANLQLE